MVLKSKDFPVSSKSKKDDKKWKSLNPGCKIYIPLCPHCKKDNPTT